MKKILLLGMVLFRFIYCSAQYDIIDTSKPFKQEAVPLIVHLGIGYSDFFAFWDPVHLINNQTHSFSPEYDGGIEFNSDRLGFYFNFSYQSYLVELSPWSNNNFYDNITRANYSGSFLYHLNKTFYKSFDPYVGIRAGISNWRELNTNNSPNWHPLLSIHGTQLSAQLFLGISYYFSRNVGVFLNAGLGTPFITEGGLNFRINNR